MLTVNPAKRIRAEEALKHPWICQRERVASVFHRYALEKYIPKYKLFNTKSSKKNIFLTQYSKLCWLIHMEYFHIVNNDCGSRNL